MRKGRMIQYITVFVLAFYFAVAGIQGTARAEETTELSDGTYNYTINADGKTATLTKYIGSAADVTIPETIGNGYTVTKLDSNIFSNNTVITSVHVSKTIESLEQNTTEFYGAYNLKNITVDKGNPIFYDINGVLFKRVSAGNLLIKYPEGKKQTEYIIPQNVDIITQLSFKDSSKTKEMHNITIPDTVSEIWLQAFSTTKVYLTLTHKDAATLNIQPLAFNYLQSGSKIIVRNAAIKEKVLAAMNECAADVQVINLDDLPAEEQKDYLIPTTSLTWDGTNTTGSTTLKPGEKCQLNYRQLPANSTDNVRWSSSDPSVAKVDAVTGLIEASGGVNYGLKTGTTTITGTDESGHSITLEVCVWNNIVEAKPFVVKNLLKYKDFQDVTFTDKDNYVGETLNPDCATLPITRDSMGKIEEFYIGLQIVAYSKNGIANNWKNISWTSSNVGVADICEELYYEDRPAIGVYPKAPGTTTITATLNDNGTIFTKSFVLTVTGAANTGDRTDNNGSNNSGNGGTTPGNDSSKDNDGNTGGTISTSPTHTQPIKTYIEKGKITPTTITLTYGTTANIRIAAKGRTTCFVTNKKIAVLTSSGKLVPKNTGVTTLKVKADASGKYKGRTITYRLIVLPKKETVTYAKSLKAGQITLKWKKDTRATGYQIQYSTSSKFAKKATKTILVKNSRITKKTIQKLSGGKKYYVRVRAYKTMKINGKKTNKYGAWSRRKAVTIN